MGRLLWAVILLWTLWISRYFLIFFLYALSGDQDPTAIIQLSHISGATFLLPYAMLFSQSGELLFLILLVATLLFFKFGVRKLREAEVPA